MIKEIEYNEGMIGAAFYGNHGKMTVRNSMNGVVVEHEKEMYSFQKTEIGEQVIRDICNSVRSTYDPMLHKYYNDDDRRVFTKYLESKIEAAEKNIEGLKFAKKILSRKNVIVKGPLKESSI